MAQDILPVAAIVHPLGGIVDTVGDMPAVTGPVLLRQEKIVL